MIRAASSSQGRARPVKVSRKPSIALMLPNELAAALPKGSLLAAKMPSLA